jgi:hypothetical protein
MYTNGYTGQKYLSIVPVRHCDGSIADAIPATEFAAQSEHITLTGPYFFEVDENGEDQGGTVVGWEG